MSEDVELLESTQLCSCDQDDMIPIILVYMTIEEKVVFKTSDGRTIEVDLDTAQKFGQAIVDMVEKVEFDRLVESGYFDWNRTE